jgi:hypothetical protein
MPVALSVLVAEMSLPLVSLTMRMSGSFLLVKTQKYRNLIHSVNHHLGVWHKDYDVEIFISERDFLVIDNKGRPFEISAH